MTDKPESCDVWQTQLSWLAAEALSEREAAALRQHLTECPRCAARRQQLVSLAKDLSQMSPSEEELNAIQDRLIATTMSAIERAGTNRDVSPGRRMVAWQRLAGGILATAVSISVLWFGFRANDTPDPGRSVADRESGSGDAELDRPTLRAYAIAFARSDESLDSLLQVHGEQLALSSPGRQPFLLEEFP